MFRIHLAVFLFGISGLLGKMVTLSALYIVTGRTFFASLTLILIVALTTGRLVWRLSSLPVLVGLGVLLAFHWYAFFHSIRISTVTLGLVTFSSFPLFTTLLEPVVYRRMVVKYDVIVACLVTAGLLLVVPEYDFEGHNTQGAIWGLLAGLSFAILQIMNRLMLKEFSALQLSLSQNIFAFFTLSAIGGISMPTPVPLKDIILLLALGVLCTALAHTIFIKGLEVVEAQVASIIACLEPVYGILLAVLILSESPDLRTVVGGIVIISAVGAASRKPAIE